MIVRRERSGDIAAARRVQVEAFAPGARRGEEPVEATLLDRLRQDQGWIRDLSLVALSAGGAEGEGAADGEVVGHVVCTRGTVGADLRPALGLGPIGVLPDQQGAGVGSALVHAIVAVAEARGEAVVVLLGAPRYYQRFGFVPAADHGVEAPDPAWGEYFQVRVLDPSASVDGPFAYAEPFTRL